MMSNKYKASITFVGLSLLVSAAVAGGSLAQSSNPGQPAISRDIEVMKGIISTTLSYENGDRRSRGPYVVGWEASGVEGFYLRGQGAVFTIRVPQTPDLDLPRLEGLETRLRRIERGENRELMRAQLQLLQAQVEQLEDRRREFEEQTVEIEALAPYESDLEFGVSPEAPEPPEPPAPAAPPAPAVAPAPATPPLPPAGSGTGRSQRSHEAPSDRDVAERVAEMQERLQEVKEKQAQAKAEADARRRSLEAALVDVFAQHGDSLTQVGSNEYINFVLVGSNEPGFYVDDSTGGQTVEILSVKVSDVRELKAGRISRSEFDSRIQKY